MQLQSRNMKIFPIFTLLFGFLLRAPSAGTRARKENEAAKKNCFRRGGAGEKKSIRNETAEKEWHEQLDNTFSGSESRFVLLAQWRVGGRQESSLLIRSIDKTIPPRGQRHPKDKKKRFKDSVNELDARQMEIFVAALVRWLSIRRTRKVFSPGGWAASPHHSKTNSSCNLKSTFVSSINHPEKAATTSGNWMILIDFLFSERLGTGELRRVTT